MHKSATIITSDLKTFLAFMKQRYSLFHASNVFFRDFHFGVMTYLEGRRVHLTYTDSEEITREVIRSLEMQGILRKIDDRSWLLSYPEYRKESKKADAPAKPAAPAQAAPSAPTPAT